MCYIITKIICICEWKALHRWNRPRNTENRNHFRNELVLRWSKKKQQPKRERDRKKCHLQLSEWINENLLEYKASSSENSELENWKESGYEIGKWSIWCFLYFVLFFPFEFLICFGMKILFFVLLQLDDEQRPTEDNFFENKKIYKETSVTSNDFG